MTIDKRQSEIASEFSQLDGDLEMSVLYLMELGQKLGISGTPTSFGLPRVLVQLPVVCRSLGQ